MAGGMGRGWGIGARVGRRGWARQGRVVLGEDLRTSGREESDHTAQMIDDEVGSIRAAQGGRGPGTAGGASDGEAGEAEVAGMAAVLPHVAARGAYEVHDNDEDPLGWCDSQNEFEFTLDLLLDGLARAAEG